MTATKRKKKRKKNRILFYLVVFVFIIVAGITLSLTVFFNIENITVDGNTKYTAEQIAAASGITQGNNLFRINCTAAEQSVLAAFGYLDQVTIDRNFPSGLSIHVTESAPKFSAKTDQGYLYISGAGRILESAVPNAADGSIVVEGFDLEDRKVGDFINQESDETMSIVQTVLDTASELSIDGITRISASSVVDIRIYLSRNIRIDIGSSTDMEYKLTFAKKIMEEELGQTDTGIIDIKQAGKAYFRSAENLE
jgi:cell division septal protein FtsQ